MTDVPKHDFSGRVVIVTGAGSGMGEAAATLLADRGASVVLAGRRAAELERVAAQIEADGGTSLAVPTDASAEADVRAMVDTAIARFGRLDAAFNNAGIEGVFAPITELNAADFDATMAVNLRGVWLCAKYEIAAMVRSGNRYHRSALLAAGHAPARRVTPEPAPSAAARHACRADRNPVPDRTEHLPAAPVPIEVE